VPRLTERIPSQAAPSDPAPETTRFTRRRLLVGIGLGFGVLGLGAAVEPVSVSEPSVPTPKDPWTTMWEIGTDGDVSGLLVAGDTLYAATPARFYAINPDGVVRWQVAIGPARTRDRRGGRRPPT
jgi:hypothetical protein